jgi:hypothetical protein
METAARDERITAADFAAILVGAVTLGARNERAGDTNRTKEDSSFSFIARRVE